MKAPEKLKRSRLWHFGSHSKASELLIYMPQHFENTSLHAIISAQKSPSIFLDSSGDLGPVFPTTWSPNESP
jgi:hypothetical protein